MVSVASPVGLHCNGPGLGPSFDGGFVLCCGGFAPRAVHDFGLGLSCSGALGSITGGVACSPRANTHACEGRGIGNG